MLVRVLRSRTSHGGNPLGGESKDNPGSGTKTLEATATTQPCNLQPWRGRISSRTPHEARWTCQSRSRNIQINSILHRAWSIVSADHATSCETHVEKLCSRNKQTLIDYQHPTSETAKRKETTHALRTGTRQQAKCPWTTTYRWESVPTRRGQRPQQPSSTRPDARHTGSRTAHEARRGPPPYRPQNVPEQIPEYTNKENSSQSMNHSLQRPYCGVGNPRRKSMASERRCKTRIS